MSSSNPYVKYWMVTINNPLNDQLPGVWTDVQYAVWQREKGEQGTEHLQVYVVFSNKKRRQWCNSHCTAAHWEPRKGNHKQAKDYVTKEDTRIAGPWECGEEGDNLGGQGKRNDLTSLKRALDEGKSETDIAQDDELFAVWARHHKIIPRYKMLRAEHQRDWQTTVTVYWGPSGSGKSRRARDEAGPGAFWLPKPSSHTAPLYWDGYEGQEHVVIDEFYGWMSRDTMQRVIDRYPLPVACRGYSAPFVAKKVWITSNDPPEKWWKIGLGAMERRLQAPIGTVVHIDHIPLIEDANGARLASFVQPAPAPEASLLFAQPEEIPLTPNRSELERWFRAVTGDEPGPVGELDYELFGCEFE